MLIAIIGENCVGKSTLANKIIEKLSAKIFTTGEESICGHGNI